MSINHKTAIAVPKIISTLGLLLVFVGFFLLWKSSPNGYAPPFYANAKILDELKNANALLRTRQKVAWALIIFGSVLQAVGTVYA